MRENYDAQNLCTCLHNLFYVLHSSKNLLDLHSQRGAASFLGCNSATTSKCASVITDLSTRGSDVEKEERQARHFTLAHCTKGGDGERTS